MRALDQSLPLKLLKARELVMAQFRPHLHAHGVTDQQWRVLRALAEYPELDAGRLARMVALKMPSLSRIMNDLARRDYLEKIPSRSDRRLINLRITPRGREVFNEMAVRSEGHYAGIEKALGKSEYTALVQRLDHLLAALQGDEE